MRYAVLCLSITILSLAPVQANAPFTLFGQEAPDDINWAMSKAPAKVAITAPIVVPTAASTDIVMNDANPSFSFRSQDYLLPQRESDWTNDQLFSFNWFGPDGHSFTSPIYLSEVDTSWRNGFWHIFGKQEVLNEAARIEREKQHNRVLLKKELKVYEDYSRQLLETEHYYRKKRRELD